MNDVNELWSSPWRTLQKNLASGFSFEGSSGAKFAIGQLPLPPRMVADSSWLVRAHSRTTQVARKIQ
jgi:hypothetical protein